MGKVYRAHDPLLGEDVALKILTHLDAEQIFRIKQEFRVIREIRHPNLVRLHDLFVDEGTPFFTMELLRGQTLEDYLKVESRQWDAPEARDLQAFRKIFLQFAEAIKTVHQAGLLHRDIKPANVFVTGDGRVVLLDFGLCRFLQSELSLHGEGTWVGSFRYMAPESILGQPPGIPSDWYAYGVAMAEALLPGPLFAEDPVRIYQEKIRPLPADRLAPMLRFKNPGGEPVFGGKLIELVSGLLAFDPAERPGFSEVSRILEMTLAPSDRAAHGLDAIRKIFIGRQSEKKSLEDAFAGMLHAGPGIATVRGVGGIGKTTFVDRVFADLGKQTPFFYLQGKCNIHEAIPFKAIDPLIDGLSRILAGLHPDTRTLVFGRGDQDDVKPHPELLSLFPVLSPNTGVRTSAAVHSGSAQELLTRASRQLGGILNRLSQLRPVVLFIDDLQWGDVDSLRFIRELLSQIPHQRILLLMAYRPADFPSGLKEELEFLVMQFPEKQTVIDLLPLDVSDLKELSRQLLLTTGGDIAKVQEVVVRESGGNPYLAVEVALQEAIHPLVAKGGANTTLRARMTGLSPAEGRIARYMALSFAPLEMGEILTMLGMAASQRGMVFDMCGKRLLRTLVQENEIRVDMYHELLRDALVKGLSQDEKDSIHRDFVANYEAKERINASILFRHHLALSHRRASGTYALQAAQDASQAYAFSEAVEFFRMALRLRPPNQETWRIQASLAEALHQAGRPGEAASQFEAASEACRAVGGSLPQWVGLLIESTSQYFFAGLWEKGRMTMDVAAKHLRLQIPRTSREAVRQATMARIGFLFRALPERKEPQAPPSELDALQLKLYRGASWGLAMLDHKTSDALTLQFLNMAVKKGSASDVARAFALEASTEANIGVSIPLLGPRLARRSQALLAKAQAIAGATSPKDQAHVLAHRSSSAFFLGQWEECVSHGNASVTAFRRSGSGYDWGMVVAQAFMLAGLAMNGRIAEMKLKAAEYWRDAEAREDLNAAMFLKGGEAVYVPIALGNTDAHFEQLEKLESRLAVGKFTSHHYSLLVARVQLHLYRGECEAAWTYMHTRWPALKAELFLNLDGLGVQLRYLYGRACLALLIQAEQGSPSALSLSAGSREIKEQIRSLSKSRLPHATPFRQVLEAGLLKMKGKSLAGRLSLETAASAFDQCGMKLFAEAARWQAASFRNQAGPIHEAPASGEVAVAKRTATLVAMAQEGIADPVRLAKLLVPA